ncbi:MAG TPA: serine/threonine-protein kinase, partial [Polyangiaceae bacterium]
LLWLLTSRGRLNQTALALADAVPMAAMAVAIGVSGYVGWDQESQRYGVTVAAMMLSMARVLVVPSTWRRTLVLSLLVSLGPLTAALLRTLDPMPGIDASARGPLVVACLWGSMSVALSALGSKIIFGLRREIREARELGQYTLGEKLGEGGMGAVYLAKHRMLRRPTAVKLLPPDKAGQTAIDRFEREVQTTATLRHPNTVSIFDYGRSPDGIFYYAMEYLEGVDLATLVEKEGPQPERRVAHILRQVCGSLAEAHARGLIHRDIKPANIILAEQGGEPDFVKVVDFGLVKDLSTPSDLTRDDAISGTPAYLAPECVTEPELVGPASDIYALGAVGYFLLTGTHVFPGKTVVEVVGHHLNTTPEPPSERLGRNVDARLEATILACLAKRPEMRPESARALREMLGAESAGS